MNLESIKRLEIYRPYSSNTAIDSRQISAVKPHPKAHAHDEDRYIVYTHDGDAVVCVKL